MSATGEIQALTDLQTPLIYGNNSLTLATLSNANIVLNPGTGNVGIGTTAPGAKLAVEGSLSISTTGEAVAVTGSTVQSTYARFNNTGGNLYIGRENSTGTGVLASEGVPYAAFLNDAGSKGIQFAIGNTPKAIISSSGNFGIGTTAPGAAIEIGGSGNLRIGGLSVSSAVYTDSNKQLTTTAPATGTIGFWTRSGTTLWPTTNTDNVTTLGSVGIGTTSPGAKLSVYGTNFPLATFTRSDASGSAAIDLVEGSGGYTRLATNGGTNDFSIRPGGSTAMTILSGGNVGIGTTSPQSALHIVTSGTAIAPASSTALTIQCSGGAGSSVLFSMISGNTGDTQINFGDTDNVQMGQISYRNTTDSMDFYTNQTPKLTISSGGNVWMGGTAATTSPALAVQSGGNVGIGTTNPVQ
jgi:hypothetical protein